MCTSSSQPTQGQCEQPSATRKKLLNLPASKAGNCEGLYLVICNLLASYSCHLVILYKALLELFAELNYHYLSARQRRQSSLSEYSHSLHR